MITLEPMFRAETSVRWAEAAHAGYSPASMASPLAASTSRQGQRDDHEARVSGMGLILLKNSPTSSSAQSLRNNDSIKAGRLNHRCACKGQRDRILRSNSARGIFQQNRPLTGHRAPQRASRKPSAAPPTAAHGTGMYANCPAGPTDSPELNHSYSRALPSS